MKRFLYLVCMLIVAMACKEIFQAPPKALLLATFYNSFTKQSMSPIVTVLGVGRDSLLNKQQPLLNVLLPLTNQDSTRYIIWLDSKADSITLVHKTTQRYASVETGFYYDYKLLSVKFTHNSIDSLKIIDSLVTTKWNENIKLYIHPLQSLLLAKFYNSQTGKAISPVITIHEVGSKTLLKDKKPSPNVLLPLSIKDTTRYIILFDSKPDSLIFIHKTTKIDATVDRASYYEYKLLSVRFTHTSIDSLKIINNLVTIKWNENIKLYIHPLPVSGN